jgi:hypothetical protein
MLTELVAEVVRDCICAAFDPPCAPCEDTDVLLACLEVSDCTVVRICNAERDYVISGPALRYWLPTGSLHEWLESFCCSPDRGSDVARAEPDRAVATTPWERLGLRDPTHIVRDVMERVGAARAAPYVPSPAADGADVDATAQQVAALAGRVAELTEQLTQNRARLDKTEAKLGKTQAELRKTQQSLSALGSQSQADPAPPGQARTRQRGTAASQFAAVSLPMAAGSGNGDQQASIPRGAAETQAPADAGTSQADAGEPATGPDIPETSDDT